MLARVDYEIPLELFGCQFDRWFGDQLQRQSGGLRQHLLAGGAFEIIKIVKCLGNAWAGTDHAVI